MRTLIAFLFITITFNSTVMAQKKRKYKEIRITKTSEIIEVSADSLWNIVRKFENVGTWFSSIDHATGTGEPEFEGATCSERTCHVAIKGYDKIHEKLTHFDGAKRELAYELTEGGPKFLLFAGNHWTVIEVSPGRSQLKMDATMHLKPLMGFLFGGKIKKTVEKNLPAALYELKVYAETGEVAESKKERMKKLQKKKRKKAAAMFNT